MAFKRVPRWYLVTLGQHNNVGEKPIVIMHTCINRRAGSPSKPIYSGRQTNRRTSRGHTGFLIHLPFAVLALIFIARKIQPSLFLVDREVEFCVPRKSQFV